MGTEMEPSDSLSLEALSRVELLVMDFDGVLTNNKVFVDQYGNESVQCDRSDSLGIGIIKNMGVEVLVISKERNDVVLRRCEKLDVECHHGIDDKLSLLREIIESRGVLMSQVCYMGNDRNDVECMRSAGISFAPNDSWPEALESSDYVTKRGGGDGAVREMCEIIEGAINKLGVNGFD